MKEFFKEWENKYPNSFFNFKQTVSDKYGLEFSEGKSEPYFWTSEYENMLVNDFEMLTGIIGKFFSENSKNKRSTLRSIIAYFDNQRRKYILKLNENSKKFKFEFFNPNEEKFYKELFLLQAEILEKELN